MNIPKELGDRFIVDQEIVRRPNSIIFRGRDKTLGERGIAIKVFLSQPGGNSQFIEQYNEQVAKLRTASHGNLVPIISGGCQDDFLYLAMELIEGGNLYDALKATSGPQDIDLALNTITELAKGVAEIHEHGLVHGHVDSRAVLFKGEEVRLAGYCFPVIGKIQGEKTSEGRFIVEPAYVSPEQVMGSELDGRTDIFALSVLLFELVTGKRPFQADSPLQTAMARLGKDTPSPAKLNSAVSPLLDAAIKKGLASARNDRYSSVSAFIEAINAGRRRNVNPFAEEAAPSGADAGLQTIGVSMSVEAIRSMLNDHDGGAGSAAQANCSKGPANDSATLATGTFEYLDDSDSSFILLTGDKRGERYWLKAGQTLIGSDSSCGISISGKGIPPRYAIVIAKGGSYSVGPLSPQGLVINDRHFDTADDVPLRRGDLLSVGNHKLRFVEAKEVFTLQDAVAERIIDRAPAKTPKYLAIAAFVALLLCFVFYLGYQQTLEAKNKSTSRSAAKEALEKKTLISKLRAEGDDLFKKGALVEPEGANAKMRFGQILDLDPDDIYAKRRLTEIEEQSKLIAMRRERKDQIDQQVAKLIADGDRYFQAGSYITPPGSNAREAYQAVFNLDPTNEIARAKLVEVDRALNDMVGRVTEMVNKAKELQAAGQWTEPAGENAFEYYSKVLALDSGNTDAKEGLYSMAAESIVRGDRAKGGRDIAGMQKNYLVAQTVGVDPSYVAARLEGIDLIKRAGRSDVIFVDRKDPTPAAKSQPSSSYLDSAELTRRVQALNLQQDLNASQKNKGFYDMRSR